MTLSPSPTETVPGMVKKIYNCPVCKKIHEIYFPPDFASNRSKFPFVYVYLHDYTNAPKIEDKDKEILTTLYVDAQLNIRGVEAVINEAETNILSKKTSKEMISKLTMVIMDMQDDHDELAKKYNELEEKYNALVNK